MKDDLFSQLYENIKKIGLTKWIMLGIAGVLLIASSYLKKDEVNENKARYSQYEEKIKNFNSTYYYILYECCGILGSAAITDGNQDS